MKYRPDIDGLRAIAILAVVGHHAGVPGFGGGFVGVDIFFVISGYLITGLLEQEMAKTGRIHLGRFVARRIRRLLPAFFLVVTATLLAALLVMFPQELPRLGKSAIAAAFISSNVHFLNYSGGYFDPSTDLMPLLHTWSLGAEEQYYLLWPLLLWAAWRHGARSGRPPVQVITWVLAAILLASFVANVALVGKHQATVFYMMPFRAWEYAIGGLLILAEPALLRGPAWRCEALFWLGAATTLGSIALVNDVQPYPGWQALLPVLGTAALILGGTRGGEGAAARLLGNQGMVGIGLVSYSWYLWHWPLLALPRAWDIGQRSLLRDILLSLAALLLAWLTYRLVEAPIRFRRPRGFQSTRGTLLSGLALTLGLVAIASGVVEYGKQRAAKLNSVTEVQVEPAETARQEQCAKGRTADACSVGPAQAPISIATWGDSHIGHWSPVFMAHAQIRQTRILIRTAPTCPPLLEAVPYKKNKGLVECGRLNDDILAEIRRLAAAGSLQGVVLSARWNEYQSLQETDPGAITAWALADHWKSLGGNGEGKASVGTPPYDHAGSVKALEDALGRTLDSLSALGLKILLIAPTPELYFNGPQCLYLRGEAECRVARAKVEDRRRDTLAVLGRVASRHANVRLYDPIAAFCDATTCYTRRDGLLQYTDHDHISARKAMSLSPDLYPLLDWLQSRELR